jgi:hypothetical protein
MTEIMPFYKTVLEGHQAEGLRVSQLEDKVELK